MLKLRQVEKGANNIHVQQRFMILTFIAKAFGFM